MDDNKVAGPMGDVSDAAAAVKVLCDKASAKLDELDAGGLARLVKMFDPDKIERLLRSRISAGVLPDILKD